MAPTFTIASLIWRQLKRATQDAWTDKSEQEHRIDFPGGGSLSVRSADNPDSLRGEGLDGLGIDEAAFLPKAVWTTSLRPALTDKRGWVMMITTPNGWNWVKDTFDAAAVNPEWERWQLPSSDNPIVDAAELEAARLDMGLRAFAQEHLAQFTNVEGAEFADVYFHDGMWFDDWPSPDNIRLRIMALDPSKGKSDKSDYSAFVMLCLDWDGVLWVDADIQRRDVWRIVEDGLSLAQWFRPDAFGVETNQFQEMLEGVLVDRSRATGMTLPIWAVNNTENKVVRVRATLTPHLARGEFRFKRGSPGAKLLVEQLRGFPLEKHDDGPDALEQAVRLCRTVFNDGQAGHPSRPELVSA